LNISNSHIGILGNCKVLYGKSCSYNYVNDNYGGSLCQKYFELASLDNINEKRLCRLNSVVHLISSHLLIYVASHKNFKLRVFTQSGGFFDCLVRLKIYKFNVSDRVWTTTL